MRIRVPAVLLTSCLLLAGVLVLQPAASAQWLDLGNGMAGTSGTPMVLQGEGPLLPTAGTKITLDGGLPSAGATLVVGLTNIGAPFKGGVLIPNPDILLPVTFDAAGHFQIIFSWPTDIPAGFQLYWQGWMADAGGPLGFAASNGLESTAS